ncbi:hypothetical protein PoB_005992800 [Plakobranchus ocellatus]|uniref:Uncharacterized protein n=1 Tax=Plakobranchus ocellatus TaxID=259542 RepID=A0AAV4CNI1_9GAST|nr:hypothetical protein PoB_005992800 [Plakobranchus ocellatus]
MNNPRTSAEKVLSNICERIVYKERDSVHSSGPSLQIIECYIYSSSSSSNNNNSNNNNTTAPTIAIKDSTKSQS